MAKYEIVGNAETRGKSCYCTIKSTYLWGKYTTLREIEVRRKPSMTNLICTDNFHFIVVETGEILGHDCFLDTFFFPQEAVLSQLQYINAI